MSQANYNPDVLSCLANLSNDEVFTPPNLVNDILDLLPTELWSNPNTKFLDPVSKSGVFLREMAKRLMKGLEAHIPDDQERLNHIFSQQLYGIAVTELTSLLSRRSVYCSKNAIGEYSICETFTSEQGNIHYKRTQHTWQGGKCTYCGASQEVYDREDAFETYAYNFIHTNKPEKIFNMKFDVIVGNPPYQLSDGGAGVSAKPLFHLFVNQAKKLNPKYLTMIIPARWYAGGKGLDEFREQMLSDERIKILYDFESSKDCFEGVNIAGGICYFLWDKDYSGECKVINVNKYQKIEKNRKLNKYEIFIRTNNAIGIVEKVLSKSTDTWDNHNYPRNPFGFVTKYRGKKSPFSNSIRLLSSDGFSYVDRKDVLKNKQLIDNYKILIGRLVPSNGELDVNPNDGYKVITNPRIIGPNEVTTESYLMIGAFKIGIEAKHFQEFMTLKFTRFLLRQAISSVNVTKDSFRFIPFENFTEPWTDEKLYKKYGLTNDEISFIESMIRPMDLTSNTNDDE